MSRGGVCSSYILTVVAVIEETTYNILFGVITLSSLCNVIQGVCVCRAAASIERRQNSVDDS